MKKWTFMLLALLGLGALLTLGWLFLPGILPGSGGNKVIQLAVVAPLSGKNKANGDAMLKGIRLYLEHVEQTGQLQHAQIKLLVFNDQDRPQVAARVAAEIAFEGKALLVLGHYASQTSLAASDIYKHNGVPVITASATAETLTQTNEWYFRIVPHNRWQAEFAVNYIKYSLQHDSASIIFEKSAYGASLAENFVKAAEKIELNITKTWNFDPESDLLDKDLRTITTELRAHPDPGALFFATYEAEAVRIITSVKYPGTNYTIVGSDTFSTKTFIEELKQYSQERVQAGYYSDDIYVVSPFLIEFGNNRTQKFKQAYIAKYTEEPTWLAACYYDAAALAVEAIQRAEVYGKSSVRNERRKIREALTGFSGVNVAMPGITGNMYFNSHGDVRKVPVMGIYQEQHLLPAFMQYQIIPQQPGQRTSFSKRLLGTRVILYGDISLTPTQVVYTGIDVNQITNLDTKNLSYTIDFYLWFRFQGDFETADITFPNALRPITLEKPVLEVTNDGITTRAYHVRGDFTGPFTFFGYPFDRQTLWIRFHHKSLPRNSLLFVRDLLGIARPTDALNDGTPTIAGISRWRVTDVAHFEESASNVSFKQFGSAQTIAHSQFNLTLRITRAGRSWIIKSFFPIGLMFLLSYYLYFIPSKKFNVQLLTGIAIILVNALYQEKLAFSFSRQEFIVMDYLFFTFYGLVGIALLISILNYIFYKRGAEHRLRVLVRTGRILYLIVVGLVSIIVTYMYATI